MEGLSCKRVRQVQGQRVQENPLRRSAAVQFVAQNRKAALAKMDADLVGAAGEKFRLDKKAAARLFQNLKVRPREFSALFLRNIAPLCGLALLRHAAQIILDGKKGAGFLALNKIFCKPGRRGRLAHRNVNLFCRALLSCKAFLKPRRVKGIEKRGVGGPLLGKQITPLVSRSSRWTIPQ